MAAKQTGSEHHREEEYRIGWRMAGLGLEVSTQVLAGALLGWLFDQWQGTAPKGVTYGAIAGIIVGMWSLVRGGLKLNALLEKNHPTTGRGKPIPFEDEDDDEFDSNDAGDPRDTDDEHDDPEDAR